MRGPVVPFAVGSLDPAIARGLAFLQKAQLPHGEFTTLIDHEATLSNGMYDGSPFATTFVLHALRQCRGPAVDAMAAAALDFLESEREPGGVWRYFSRRHWKHARIPPDLDDTSCACHALRSYGRPVPANRWVFHACRDARQRYRTWVLPQGLDLRLRALHVAGERLARRRLPPMPASRANDPRFAAPRDLIVEDDVDPLVNANVVLYLGECAETHAAIGWLTSLVRERGDRELSQYYKDRLTLFYMICRAFGGGATSLRACGADMTEQVLLEQGTDGSFGPPLRAALAAAVLLTFAPEGEETQACLTALVRTQRDDGSWPRHAFYGGPHEFWGSEELTTALALEALARARGQQA